MTLMAYFRGCYTTDSVLFCALLIAAVEGGDNLLLSGRRVLGLLDTKQVGFLQCQQPPIKPNDEWRAAWKFPGKVFGGMGHKRN